MSGESERDDVELSTEDVPPESPDTAVGDASEDQTEIQTETESGEDDPLENALAKAEENWEKYVRTAAELENVRKRAKRDVEHAHRFSLERFSRELLGVRDGLELGIEAGIESGAETLLEGAQATLKLLAKTMQHFGIDELEPLGEPFDPELHEAMTMQPTGDVEPGSVLTVFQKGYTLNGRLLRPARVVVAQEMPAQEMQQDGDTD